MLEKLITASIKNKLIVTLCTIGLIIGGIYATSQLSIDAVPDITNNQVQIVTVSSALAAKEVEQFITFPIEKEMANVQNVEEIRSISRYGLSVVTVVFKEKVPVLDARQLVNEQLQTAREEIPEEFGSPFLMPITTGLGEIYQYTLDVVPEYKHKYDAQDLRTIHDWIVKRQLNGIPGIVEISSFGGYIKQYEVQVNPQALSSFNLSLLDVNRALQQNNQNTGGSYLKKGPYAYYIKTEGLISNIEDIKKIVVANYDNISVLISDIANVKIGHPIRFGAMTKDGQGEAVGGITLMLKGGNASQVIQEVKNRIEDINNNLPQGISIEPYLDRSVLVNKVIRTVSTNLIEGGLIVIFILVLLLGNLRAGLLVASVIPLSMLFALSMMHIFGITATVMSLGAIDFGLIVDATVIIVESIVFQIEQSKQKLHGKHFDQLVLDTTQKIKKSASFGALIILIVYIPILALTGIEGKMFRPMALTVSFAIVGALILSFTYVPVMSTLFLKQKKQYKRTFADRIMDVLYRLYKPAFELALKFKLPVLILAAVIFIFSILVFNRLGAEFLPDLDEGDLAMQLTVSTGSSLEESIKATTKAETILLKNFPEVITVVSKIGTAEVPTDPMAIEDADVMIILKPRDQWVSANSRQELADKMKEKLSRIIGVSFEFTQPIQLRFNELLTGAKSDVVVKIYGEDLNLLFDKANYAARIIADVEGAADIKVEQIEGLPQVVINYKRSQVAHYGLNIEDINTFVRTAFAGEKVGNIFEGERKFDLVVKLQKQSLTGIDALHQLYIKTPSGGQVLLNELADIQMVDMPVQISRDDTHRRISIGINVRNRDVLSVVEDIQAKLGQQLKLPAGYHISYGGKFENLQSAVSRLQVVVPIALLLIFILLYFAFKSMKNALNILVTIPLSIIGGIFALWLRGLPFSISAGIGFIALFGVAVLDGIVLINQLNDLQKKGIDNIHDRLRQATKTRLRPVVVTSAVASLGFLPMALSTSAGAEVQRPLATVVIGGIITSTFLTMIILPLVYYYFQNGIKLSRKIKPTATLLAFFILLPFLGKGQNSDRLELSLEQAITKASNTNVEIINSRLQIDKNAYLQKSTFKLGTTEFNYQNGQINSALIDYNFSVTQNFGNPFQNMAQSRYLKTENEWLHLQSELKKHEIIYTIKTNYNLQQSLFARKQQMDTLIAQLEKFMKIIDLRYSQGEVYSLEKLNMQSKLQQYLMQQQEYENQLQQSFMQLQKILFSDTLCVFRKQPFDLIRFDNLLEKNQGIENTTQMRAGETSVRLTQNQQKITKTELLPEIYAGYFNQQIDGTGGFSGWEIGIGIPIFAFSEIAKNKAAKVDILIAENNRKALENNILTKKRSLQNQLTRKTDNIRLIETTLLANSREIIEQANLLYSNGEISYHEYLQSVENAANVQITFIDEIYEANKIILQLQLLKQ